MQLKMGDSSKVLSTHWNILKFLGQMLNHVGHCIIVTNQDSLGRKACTAPCVWPLPVSAVSVFAISTTVHVIQPTSCILCSFGFLNWFLTSLHIFNYQHLKSLVFIISLNRPGRALSASMLSFYSNLIVINR